MRIGYMQFAPAFHDPEQSFSTIVTLMEKQRADCDLLVLPELALSGYLFSDLKELRSIADEIELVWKEKMAVMARDHSCAIVYGFPESDGSGRIYNSSCTVLPTGVSHTYRKAHLYGFERLVFTPGDSPFTTHSVQYEAESTKIGMLICFDHMFPEPARTLALDGAQIICHPSNLVMPKYAQINSQCYAQTNRVFWVLANRVGTEVLEDGRTCTFTGRSHIVAPDGEILISSSADTEEMVIIDIDPSVADTKKLSSGNDLFSERRVDLYR